MTDSRGRQPGRPNLRTEFVEAMRRLTAAATIVTSAHEQGSVGMTATAVCSLSAEPPAILTCIKRSASIWRWLTHGETFCVNLLAVSHAAVASEFGGRSPVDRRFEYGAWIRKGGGPPYLVDALCNIFCEVDLATDYATHTIIVGRVTGVRLREAGEPLLYGDGGFHCRGRAI